MWRVAVVCFVASLALTLARPAWADSPMAPQGFTWAQVVVLVGIGAAWGDMRRQVADLRRDFDALKDKGGEKK